MAIDRAVLLPGQELMERMDREFQRTGDFEEARIEVEGEVRREESERHMGKGRGERDREDTTEMHTETIEEAASLNT